MPGVVTIIREDGSTFSFDGEERIGFAPRVNITQLPVEDGTSLSDNAQEDNEPINIVAYVTNTPFALPGVVGGQRRTQDAADNLRSILGRPITLVIASNVISRTIPNVLLGEMPHDFGLVEELTFDLRFVRVNIAEAQLVLIPPEQPPAPNPEIDKGSDKREGLPDKQDVGEQPARKELSARKSEEDDRSFLAKALDGDLL